MRALAIVEFQIAADRGACLADAVVGSEIDLFVFDRAPEPFDEDVVAPGSLAVHADGDGVRQEQAGEVGAGELAAPSLRWGRLWSVLKISGLPCFASASSTASRQNSTSIVIETRQDKTLRLNQSTTAAR